MQMHRVNIGSMIHPDGVTTWTQSFDAVEVSGERYVDAGHALIKAAGQWHDTLEQARDAAATDIEGTARVLMQQAAKLRSLGNGK